MKATSYAIAYKDDDGEVTDITTDTDLTEAIQYFQAGSDDPPMSSAASILSGRSFGTRKITLRVDITVDYDGPSLSDTSSLISLEEYKNRNGSQVSFSFGAPSIDLDDDSVTVSSRDTGAPSRSDNQSSRLSQVTSSEGVSNGNLAYPPQRSSSLGHSVGAKGTSKSPEYSSEGQTQRGENPFADELQLSAASRYPEDPSAVFERLKLEESVGDESSVIELDTLSGNDRGAAWLRDQNERTMRSRIRMLPEPSDSDGASFDLGGDRLSSDMDGDLALRRDFRGKYYYSYTSVGSSGLSQSHNSVSEENLGGPFEEELSVNGDMDRPRPTSRHLNWLAAQQIHPVPQPKHTNSDPSSQRSASYSPYSEPAPSRRYEGIPPEVLQYIPTAPPPVSPDELTDCSECGVLLDSMRYVCSTCGEKPPVSSREKGKGKNIFYPPTRHRTSSSSPVDTSSSRTFFEESESGQPRRRYKPLPSIPSLPSLSQYQLAAPGPQTIEPGYELCSGCIQSIGVFHAIAAGLASSPGRENSSPSSPEDAQRALSQWRRSAPKHKGQLRHAYLEKVWGHTGWEDVGQSIFYGSHERSHGLILCLCLQNKKSLASRNARRALLSIFAKDTNVHRVRNSNYVAPVIGNGFLQNLVTCLLIIFCRYSQVHDLHPSHAFFIVPDKPVRTRSDPDILLPMFTDSNEEQCKSLEPHLQFDSNVVCSHEASWSQMCTVSSKIVPTSCASSYTVLSCMLDIVGARFHCAICDSVDICSNCESAGLPGNLDSSDDGHNSSHIMIKVVFIRKLFEKLYIVDAYIKSRFLSPSRLPNFAV